MIQNASPSVQKKSEDFGQRLSDVVRENPIPAALVGMGVLWLFMGGNRTTIARMGEDTTTSRLSGGLNAAANLGSSLVDTGKKASEALVDAGSSAARVASEGATELVSDTSEMVANAAGAVQRSGNQMMTKVQSELSDLFERQPLAVGAFGLIMGAASGTAFQTTQVEKEAFGETSQSLKEQAEELVSAGLDTARAAAAGVSGDAPAQTNETAKAAGEAVTSVAHKVAAVADTALQAVKKELRPSQRKTKDK